MSRNEIGLDQIERRLGDLRRSSRSASPYAGEGSPFTGFGIDEQSESAILSSGFIATFVAIFMFVGSGTYFYTSGRVPLPDVFALSQEETYVSAADATCKSSWREGKDNTSAMRCYLSNATDRLCNPDEKAHLGRLLKRYRTENDQRMAKLAASIKQLQKAQTAAGIDTGVSNIFGGGAEDIGQDSKKLVSAKSLREFNAAMEDVRSGLGSLGLRSGREAIKDAKTKQKKMQAELIKAEGQMALRLRFIVEAGYLQEGDLGWFPDAIAKDAFASASGNIVSRCAQ